MIDNSVLLELNTSAFKKYKKNETTGYDDAIAKQTYMKKKISWKKISRFQEAEINNKKRASITITNHVSSLAQKYDIGKDIGKGSYGTVKECSLKG